MSGHTKGPWEAVEVGQAAPKLLEAVRRLMPRPFTGNPTHAELVSFWTREKKLGRGEADDVLFALSAIAAATGRLLENKR